MRYTAELRLDSPRNLKSTEFILNDGSLYRPPWRNWLARSAVNRKVGGSSPPGGAFLVNYLKGSVWISYDLSPTYNAVKLI